MRLKGSLFKSYYHDAKSMYNNGPKPLKMAQKPILLLTLGVQVIFIEKMKKEF